MPTLQKLADKGLDVFAMAHDGAVFADAVDVSHRAQPSCERMRSHHRGEPTASPGAAAGFPPSARRSGRCCRTTAGAHSGSGKNHNVPEEDIARGASRSEWPLQKGFDRFYGFLGGETNNWYPDLVEDNHFIDQPYPPEEGYHLSKDLADQAIADDPRPEGGEPLEAVVHVVLPRREPRAAPQPRRNTPTSTRASSTTATRRIASGCCRA